MPLRRFAFADATLLERFSSPENTLFPGREGERRRTRGPYEDSRVCIHSHQRRSISFSSSFFLLFFFRAGRLVARSYRRCVGFPGNWAASLLHVIKRANNDERDLVWVHERERCKITPLSAVPTCSLPATLGYLSRCRVFDYCPVPPPI